MLTIVDIIYKHDKYNICEFKKARSLFSDHHFIIMSSWNTMLDWVKHGQSFITSEPG